MARYVQREVAKADVIIMYITDQWQNTNYDEVFQQVMKTGKPIIILKRRDIAIPPSVIETATGLFTFSEDESDLKEVEEKAKELAIELFANKSSQEVE